MGARTTRWENVQGPILAGVNSFDIINSEALLFLTIWHFLPVRHVNNTR
jgi:hypothetical protein